MSKAASQPDSRSVTPVAAVQAFLKKRRMHWSRAAVHAAMPLWFIGLGILYLVSNPADDSLWLVHNMGFTGFLLLVFSLACTPLGIRHGLVPVHAPAPHLRPVGLLANPGPRHPVCLDLVLLRMEVHLR